MNNNIGCWANLMAKKNSRHYPVVKTYPIQPAGVATNTLVDQARCLSVINRRLYRYGRYYETKVDVDHDYAGPAIEVFVLRDDWAVQKAFQMAYQEYLDNTKDERENLGSNMVARWEDFRVRDGLIVPKNEGRPVLHSIAGVIDSLNAGEFALSNVVDGAGTERTFSWGAGSASIYGILDEYNKMSNAQNAPSTVVIDAPYENIDTQVDEATHDNLQVDGNNPPYDQNGVNSGSPWVRVATLGGTGGVQKLSSGFFTAPCGLVLLIGYGGDPQPDSVTVTAKAGDYKGVHAPSMVEVATVNRKRKVVK